MYGLPRDSKGKFGREDESAQNVFGLSVEIFSPGHDELRDLHRLEAETRKYGCARFARRFIYTAQSSAKIACGDIDGILIFVDILQDGDKGCVRRGAGNVQL
jgi:hypothetical protein